MNTLIIGEAGERPFYDGPSASRLRRWFNVRNYDELTRIATLVNICPMKGFKTILPEHIASIHSLSSKADQVYLVGKFAQRYAYGGAERHVDAPLWATEQYRWIGLPHPSGRNRQFNKLSDSMIAYFVMAAYRERRIMCLSESSLLSAMKTSTPFVSART